MKKQGSQKQSSSKVKEKRIDFIVIWVAKFKELVTNIPYVGGTWH